MPARQVRGLTVRDAPPLPDIQIRKHTNFRYGRSERNAAFSLHSNRIQNGFLFSRLQSGTAAKIFS